MRTIKYSILLLFFITIAACEVDSNCGSVNVEYVTFSSFKLNANNNETAYAIKYDSIKSPQTEVTFASADTLAIIALPLSPTTTQTDFYFYYEGHTDTISFSYEKRSSIDSPECGVIEQFVGLDTNFQTFDSLIINNDTLKRTINAPNIKFYLL